MTYPTSFFPIRIVCPNCGSNFLDGQCPSCRSDIRLHEYKGIPRLFFGHQHFGQASSSDLRRVLELCQNMHWRNALREVVGNAPPYSHLTTPVRADFLHAMPWTQIRTVLDVGAGMGFMSCDLAAYAEHVIALDALPEHAEFVQVRAQQDGLSVHAIIGDILAPPFPAASFDLVTLNGTLRDAGLWGTGDPKDVQLTLLRRVYRLLKPGGYLYIATETRFGWPYWLGLRDHSGLRFTSLMPRTVANAYCRLRDTPLRRPGHSNRGYRTHTHTPAQYADMLREVGFRTINISGVSSGSSEQRIIYDLDDYHERRHTLDRFSPSASAFGRWRRRITDCRLLYRFFEPEIVVFARRTDACSTGPLVRAELHRSSRSITQINTASKALAVIFENHVPIQVLEFPKRTWSEASAQTARAYDVVSRLAVEFGEEMYRWPICPPKIAGTRIVDGQLSYGYEYVAGRELATLVLPVHLNMPMLMPLLTCAMRGYVKLCYQIEKTWQSVAPTASWRAWTVRVSGDQLEAGARAAALDAAAYGQRQGWPLHPIHGDFGASNLIVQGSGQMVLVDWTHFSSAFLPAVDLIRFAFDILSDADLLHASLRRRLLTHVRTTLHTTLASEGFATKDYSHLHATFIAHQLLSISAPLDHQADIAARYRIDGPLSPLLSVD